MIKVEDAEPGKKGRTCTIEGSAIDIASDILTIFESMTQHETLELVLLTCIDDFITSRKKELLNKKGDK